MPAYPPVNRQGRKLGLLDIEIEHAGGVAKLDPNGTIMLFVSDMDAALAMEPVPFATSVLSGKPAVLYRSGDLEIPLTVAEIAALVGTELRPTEYVGLRTRYGMFFEIHDDFYDEDTGVALQPKGLRDLVLAAGEVASPTGP